MEGQIAVKCGQKQYTMQFYENNSIAQHFPHSRVALKTRRIEHPQMMFQFGRACILYSHIIFNLKHFFVRWTIKLA